MIFLVISVAICLLFIVYLLPRIRRFLRVKKLLNKIPGPATYPIIGNLLETATLRPDEIVKYLEEVNNRYGPILRFWAGPTIPMIVISCPEYAEVILSSTVHVNKGLMFKFLESWLGTGLLTASNEKWSIWRKVLTPAFHFSMLEKFLDVFNRNALIMVNKLDSHVKDGEFDLYPFLYNCTLDVICEATMGVKINAQKGEAKKYIECVHGSTSWSTETHSLLCFYFQTYLLSILMCYSVTGCITKRMLNFFFYFDSIYRLTSYYRTEKKLLKTLHDTSLNVIHERMIERENLRTINSVDTEENTVCFGQNKGKTFLDILLDALDANETAFSINNVREQVDTFMFEGHDTTSIALAWTIYFVGRNPDLQEKIFEELDSVFGENERSATMDDLCELKYLECVLRESLRLVPPVPMLSRVIEKDLTLGDYVVPAGTIAFINVHQLHRSSKHFVNPHKFDPSRFHPDVVNRRHPFAYIPFSAGSRNCIGQKYAMLKEKTILSTFFRKYRVESVQHEKSMDAVFELVLRPSRGPLVKIEKRK